jgi:hypothetical protein
MRYRESLVRVWNQCPALLNLGRYNTRCETLPYSNPILVSHSPGRKGPYVLQTKQLTGQGQIRELHYNLPRFIDSGIQPTIPAS